MVKTTKKTTKRATSKKATKAKATTKKASKPAAKTTSKAKTKPTADKKPKRTSALDAAAQVLAKSVKPMRAQELIAAMADQGLWTSPGGQTPHATLYTVWTMLPKVA